MKANDSWALFFKFFLQYTWSVAHDSTYELWWPTEKIKLFEVKENAPVNEEESIGTTSQNLKNSEMSL